LLGFPGFPVDVANNKDRQDNEEEESDNDTDEEWPIGTVDDILLESDTYFKQVSLSERCVDSVLRTLFRGAHHRDYCDLGRVVRVSKDVDTCLIEGEHELSNGIFSSVRLIL
jgi:hypothetical protein